jgi:dTDP-4-dehydrorhamnose reductase
MKVLITGRDGQVGRSMLEKAAGWPDLDLVAVGRADADFSQPGSIGGLIGAIRPKVVINAAAYTAVDQAEDEPELAHRVNADAAGEAAAAARKVGAAIIQLSTDYVFDGEGQGAYAEDALPNPMNAYGRSKLAGEQQVRGANPDHLILRTAWVYSPFGRNFVISIMAAAKTRAALNVVDDQVGNPTSALELANAILTVVDRWRAGAKMALGRTYHLAGSGETSWCGLAKQVMADCRRLGLPSADIRPISSEDWPTRARRPRNSTLDSAQFARDLGSKMPDWRQSIRETVERLASPDT